VVGGDLQEARGQALAERLGPAFHFVPCDVAREEEVQALIEAALSTFGRLDCLFNNAGFGGVSGEIETLTFDERYRRTVDAMLTGPLMGIRHATPHLKAAGGGTILTTASVAGLKGGYGPHVYSAIKAGVIGMTRSLARELGPAAIRVNAICPGGIATPIFAGRLAQQGGGNVDHAGIMRAVLAGNQPIRRAGEGSDIANAAAFLASDEASFITGQALAVDGGLTACAPLPPEGQEGGMDLLAKAFGAESAADLDSVLPERGQG
jgi:NAD(P)-dependent dehydrogenase (short-subunit alcohol dehydrogenase family)